MRLGHSLNQVQTQKLAMTPELRQAIAILQFSAIELSQYIEQELMENPVIELKENEIDDENNIETIEKIEPEKEEKYEIDWQEYFSDKSDLGYHINNEIKENKFENYYIEAPTLHEHLLLQLSLQGLDKKENEIGEFFIGNIDEKGYLQCTLDEVEIRYNVDLAVAERTLQIIQSFDPSGVGARNLRECLLIQVDQLGIDNHLLKSLIEHHLNDLADNGLPKVAQALKVSVQEVQKAADELKNLDPKPGRKFSSSNDTRYIVPDIVVERVNKEYIILVNDTMVPRLHINQSYREILGDRNHDSETKKFVEGKLNSASWLIKSIEQRRLTLYKVSQSIVKFQKDFFDHGIKYLKPLNLKQIALDVGLHESTISRATSNKYIQTSQGVFEMKFFFASGVDNSSGDATSSETIKRLIKEMLQAEDARKPLSDPKIAEILQNKGIDISRRTVSKYRDEMGISSTFRRKRY